jgi:hypothetical protein
MNRNGSAMKRADSVKRGGDEHEVDDGRYDECDVVAV